MLVDQLLIHGIDHVFCVPGESYLAVLDALHDVDIKVTVCRQEGGAAMMAEAHGKLTGRPAACFVTRGPGAANAVAGIHIADQDSTPLLVFVGQVARAFRGREALQELDYSSIFGSMTKWTTEIDHADRIPEMVSRAVQAATSSRPGPVVVAIPEDVLTDTTKVPDAKAAVPVEAYPSARQMEQLRALLDGAVRPLVVLGGSRWTAESAMTFAEIARDWEIPVIVSLRRQMLFSSDHPGFAGDLGFGANPVLVEHFRTSDLVILVGGRFSEVPSQGYTLLDVPVPRQRLVHVHADADELGRVYRSDLAINATPIGFVDALRHVRLLPSGTRSLFREGMRRDYLTWSDTASIRTPGRLQMAEVMRYLNDRLPANAILCNGAGNYAAWIHRFFRFRQFGTQLAPTSGSMGYGVPAAVGAKRVCPDRTVVAFAGDGCFLMNGQEFATAVQYELPILVIVIDNGMYGTIRMHQEREYPGRIIATQLRNPDFAAYAAAFGGFGERVETTEAFPGAFERALESQKPAILHCLIDPEAISPSITLSDVREAAFAARRDFQAASVSG